MEKLNCILLVDDDNITNFLTEKIVKKLDLANKVKVVMNGEEALLYLTSNCCSFGDFPDLILLDNRMPEMTGIEFMEYYNKLNINTTNKSRIIVLTASENKEDEKRLLDLGVEAYITKPL
ncbi:MAG TPA: response regulator, partial [Cytophagaceae bacterium]